MMPRFANGPHSRRWALGLLAAVALLLCLAIGLPVFWLHHHYDVALEDRTTMYGRYARIAAQAPLLDKKLADLKAVGVPQYFLKGTTPALAASEMQEMVRRSVEAGGGKVASMQIPEHKNEGAYRKIMVTVVMSSTLAAAQSVFYALESQRPYLYLDNVNLRPTNWQAPNGPPKEPDLLVQFNVVAYAHKGAE